MKHRLNPLFTTFLMVVTLVMAFSASNAWAELSTQDKSRLDLMEQALFASTYTQESSTQRLDRLEKRIFGIPHSSQNELKRLDAVHQVLLKQQPTANTVPMAPAPSTVGSSTFPQTPSGFEVDPSVVQTTPQAPASASSTSLAQEADYPILSVMEQQVFGRVYDGKIETRLPRLESKVLGAPQQGPLAARVDQLRLVVLGDTGSGSPLIGTPSGTTQQFPGIPPQNAMGNPAGINPNGYPNSVGNTLPPASAADMSRALGTVERQVLGNTYGSEPIPQRLDRLEMKVFQRTAPQADPQERLQRIISVAAADDTSGSLGGRSSRRGGGKSSIKSLLPLIPMFLLMFL